MTDQTAPASPATEITPHEALNKLWDWVNSFSEVLVPEKLADLSTIKDTLDRGLEGVTVAQKQRDLLGGSVSSWIGRFYGLKVANGELAPGALPQIVANEVGALEQACGQIAKEVQG